MLLRNKCGQGTLEYAVLMAAVVAALFSMQIYLKRGFSGGIKSAADDLGEQYNPVNFSSHYTTTTSFSRRETSANGVTRSELVVPESTTRTGQETVGAWTKGEK